MIRNDRKIAILISTYNGSLYLREQLDSILNQTFQNYTVYIRDDGSSDETIDIIKEYINKNNNIAILESNGNIGSTKSFLTLLLEVDSDYYMFCDQDDIWLDNKVEISYNTIKTAEDRSGNIPLLCYSDLTAINGEKKVLFNSMWEMRGHQERLPHSFYYLSHFNDIDGCTTIINKKAKELYKQNQNIEIIKGIHHDWLIALLVSGSNGQIIPINHVTMLFRRHQNNETNPTKKYNSILAEPYRIIPYVISMYKRFKIVRRINKISFLVFLYFKFRLYFLQNNSK